MNNNFFKRHILTIFITLSLIIGAIVLFYRLSNDPKPTVPSPSPSISPTSETVSNLETKLDNNDSKLNVPNKQETKQPKIKATSEKIAKIKAYVFADTKEKSLLPNNLTEKENSKIEELVNYINGFKNDCTNRYKDRIQTYQNEIYEYNKKIQEIKNQYPSLQSQKSKLEIQQNDLNFKINRLDNRHPHIKHLRTENIRIIGNIEDIEININNLQASQEKYEGMLSAAVKMKQKIEKDYKNSYNDISILYTIDGSLNEIYEITPPQN